MRTKGRKGRYCQCKCVWASPENGWVCISCRESPNASAAAGELSTDPEQSHELERRRTPSALNWNPEALPDNSGPGVLHDLN